MRTLRRVLRAAGGAARPTSGQRVRVDGGKGLGVLMGTVVDDPSPYPGGRVRVRLEDGNEVLVSKRHLQVDGSSAGTPPLWAREEPTSSFFARFGLPLTADVERESEIHFETSVRGDGGVSWDQISNAVRNAQVVASPNFIEGIFLNALVPKLRSPFSLEELGSEPPWEVYGEVSQTQSEAGGADHVESFEIALQARIATFGELRLPYGAGPTRWHSLRWDFHEEGHFVSGTAITVSAKRRSATEGAGASPSDVRVRTDLRMLYGSKYGYYVNLFLWYLFMRPFARKVHRAAVAAVSVAAQGGTDSATDSKLR